jgi:hypothetical protein
MNSPSLDELRDDVRRSSLGGFPMLFTSALVWLATGVLTYLLPAKAAAYAILFQGAISMPIGLFILPRFLGLPALPKGHPMTALLVQCAMVQTIALPAAILLMTFKPVYLPVAFAALVGAHFLPYAWIQRIPAYVPLAIVVGIGPYGLALVFREDAFHYTSFFVGLVLLAFSLVIRATARRPATA